MLLVMLAAVYRKDYEDRRRQEQGITKAKSEGKHKGRKSNLKRYENIQALWFFSIC